MPSPQAKNATATGIAHLRELIAALDGRVPHLERAGEIEIARDAERLRLEALGRIAEIEKSQAGE